MNIQEHAFGDYPCETCNGRGSSLCGNADPPALSELCALALPRQVRPGETIMRAGERPSFVANVLMGWVRLSKSLPDGRTQIIDVRGPGTFIGATFGHASDITAEAVGDVLLCCLDTAEFEAILHRHPRFSHSYLLRVLEELQEARDWMVLLGCRSAKERVAAYLWRLLERSDPAEVASDGVEIPLSRGDLSQLVGLTLETTSRQISRLNAEGVIALSGPRHFRIGDEDRLRELAGGPHPAGTEAPSRQETARG